MSSQIETLEASIAKLEQDDGPEHPQLKGLRVKVAGLQVQHEKDQFNLQVKQLLTRSWR